MPIKNKLSGSKRKFRQKLSALKNRVKTPISRLKAYNSVLITSQSADFKWTYRVIQDRLRYKFGALKAGIEFNQAEKLNLYDFRRNIHRLEKGLSYETIKPIFAEDYILETVLCLEQNSKQSFLDSETKKWGESVLALYFQTCLHTNAVAEAYTKYQALKLSESQRDRVPYLCEARPSLSVDYEALHQLSLRRRSIRFYLEKTVEPDLIKQALAIALQSPSACNRQSFKYLFFNEKAIVEKISKIPGGIAGYRIPSVVVLVGSYRGYFDERDINAPVIDASLSAMAFLFALETLGLASVCVNWPNLVDREKKIRQLIHLEPDEFIVMLIGIGHPKSTGKIPYSAKQPVDQILLVNERGL